jgi:hypothetical protein
MRTAATRACVTVVLGLTCLSACGGKGSPTAPAQNCTAITGPTTLRLDAGELLRLRFRAPSGMTPRIVLFTYMGLPESGFGSARISHRLYDGDRLLGAQDDLTDTVAIWKSPQSSFGTPGDTTYGLSGPAASVDFTSLVAGTFDGRIDLSVVSGSVRIGSADLAEVQLYGPALEPVPARAAPRTGLEWCR